MRLKASTRVELLNEQQLQHAPEQAMNASISFSFGNRNLAIGCLGTSDIGSPVQLTSTTKWLKHFNICFAK